MLRDKISKYRLILASNSPRRQQLLKGIDVNFEVITKPEIDELVPENIYAQDIAMFLAEHKAKSYNEFLNPLTIVITADTIVWFNNKVLNKPTNKDEAIRMLIELSDNMHIVYTGVCITTLKKQKTFYSETKVWFRNLSKSEIKYYVEKYKPYDKAGAYGAQEWLGYVAIERIEGSYFNVMGLPVQKLYSELEKFIK
ncbi:MAG: septum formation protein Maf [Bacteroidetes bacterium GWA2_32_17]|nr:MAG: septum formation protein Maf [Bacteroidetes bacterium GWA2_32_17]